MKNLQQHVRRMLACGACLAFGAVPYAAADVLVVDNRPPDHLTGNNMGFAFQTEDVSLAAGATLTGIRFWNLALDNFCRGSIAWSTKDSGDASGDLGDPNKFLWESAAGNGSQPGAERFAVATAGSTKGTEPAFQVSAVPESADVLMLMIGMTLLLCLERRGDGSEKFS